MQKAVRNLFLIFLFVSLFFLVRLHFYYAPLIGEEGIFADILMKHPQSPNFLLSGLIDGQNIYHQPAHPIVMYYALDAMGNLFSPLINTVSWLDDTEITPLLRFLISLNQFAVFLGIGIVIILRKGFPLVIAVSILVAVAISPTAVITSANLQLDGSIGVLMSGLFAMTLFYLSIFNPGNGFLGVVLFMVSFFLATGKQEWSIIALCALLFAALYLFIFKYKKSAEFKTDVSMLLIVLSGLMAGNLFSYFLEPLSYLGGLKVLWSFSHADKLLEGHFDLQKWIQLTNSRVRWICIPIALAGISTLLVFNKLKRLKTVEVLLWFYGLGLLGAYFLSNWNTEPRYFAPSLVVLAITVILLLPSVTKFRLWIPITVVVFLMFLADGLFLFNNIVKKPQSPYFDVNKISLKSDEIAILTTAEAWNKLNIDFANRDNGKIISENFAKKYHKTLYPKNYVWWDERSAENDKN